MSQLVAMIVRVDDVNNPEELSEVWRRPLPQVSLEGLEASHWRKQVVHDTRSSQIFSVAEIPKFK